MKPDKQLSATGDGKLINIYLDTYNKRGSLTASKLVHTLTIEQADAFVKELSGEIHRDTRLVAQSGGLV